MGDRDVVGDVIEAAAGPLTWDHADFARGTVDGRPISFEMRYSKSNSVLHLRGVYVGCDLGGRPVRLKVDSTQLGAPKNRQIITGDDEFDAAMEVQGWPREVCLAGLDASARQFLVDAFNKTWPYLDTVDGRLRMPRTILRKGGKQIASPEEIAVVCVNLQSIGARLVEAYDASYEEIRRTQGDAAATAWHDANVAQWGAHRSQSRVRRLAFLVGFLACGIGVAYAMTVGWF